MLTTTTTPSKLNGGVMRNVDEVHHQQHHHQQHHHQQQQQQQQQNNLDQSNNVRRPLRNDNSPDRSDNLVALIEQLGLQPSLKTPEHELSRRPILGPRASNNILVTPIKSSVASGSQNTSPDGKFSSFVVNQVNGLETPMDISMQQQQQQQIQQPCQARRDLSSLFNIDPQIWAHPSRSSTPMGSGSAGSCANSAYGGAASSASTDRSSTATGLLSSSGSPSSLTMSQIQNILTNLSFTQTSTSSERQYQSFNSALNAISPINVPPPVIPPNVYPALQQQMLILQQQRLQAFSLAQSQRHQTTDYKSFLSGVPANGYDVGRSNLNLLDTSKPLHGITSTPCSSPVDNNFSANQPIGNQQLAVGAGRSPPCGVGGGASSIQHDCHHHHHRQNNQCSPSTGVSPISGSNGHTNVAHPVVSQTSTINAQAVVTSQQSQFYPTSGTNRLQSQQPPFEIGAGSEQRLQKGPVVTGGNVDNAAKLYRSAALVSEATCTWSGQLPPKSCKSPIYSCKVFVGGVPWDITENTLVNAFKVFGNVRVEWPGREARYARSPIRPSAKGYVYMIYENEKSMKLLLQNCTQDYSGSGDYYFKLTSRRLRTKEVRQVQIIPWIISDSNYVKCPSQRLDPKKTVFVGALHGMITAEVLATVMSDLFGGVVYAGIDTDKYKYPIGSGRVVFSNNRSYYKAVTAAFVEIKTLKFTKKVQIDPYLEDATCCLCQAQSGPYFCRELMCYRYFCKQCWQTQHSLDLMRTHKPLMRNTRRCPVLSGCPSLANGTMNNGDLATPLTTVNRCILPVMTSPSSLHPVIAPPPYSAANFMMTSSFPVTVTSATASYNANAVAPSSLQMTNFLGSFSAQQTAVSQQFSERRPALPNLNLMDYTTDINDFRNHCQLFGGAGCALSGSTSTGSETSPTFQQRYDFMRF